MNWVPLDLHHSAAPAYDAIRAHVRQFVAAFRQCHADIRLRFYFDGYSGDEAKLAELQVCLSEMSESL